MLSGNFGYHPSKAESLVNEILHQTARSIMRKHKIEVIGEGASMPRGVIKSLTLEFDSRERLSKDQLRVLLFEFSKKLMQNVNLNHEIKEFLESVPFTEKNVEIVIHNNDKSGRELFDPEISVASIENGIFSYKTGDRENTFKYKNRYEETYEEAVKAQNNA